MVLLKLPKESAISCHTNSECADVESRSVVAERERVGRGTGSLGLADANYDTKDGLKTRSHCGAQRATFTIL